MAKSTTAPKTETVVEEIELKPCLCQFIEIETWTGDVPDGGDPNDYVEYIGTGCKGRLTSRTFAPGHDAKLKSLLIRAGAMGAGVRQQLGGLATVGGAQKVADQFGFGHQVAHGIERALVAADAKANDKAAKEQAKAEAKAAKKAEADAAKAASLEAAKPKKAAKAEPGPVKVRIKVGPRWQYDAVVDTKTGIATYTTAKGEVKTATEDKWSLVTT